MLKKIKEYYGYFGFKETIKKIIRYLNFQYRYKTSRTGIYELNNKEKKHIAIKEKNVYFLASQCYRDIDKNVNEDYL